MNPSISSFRQLIISKPAREQEQGAKLVRIFQEAGLPIEERADDAAILEKLPTTRASSLLVLLSPSLGWITPVEYGALASRIGEYYLNPIMGCQSSCTYCFLRARPGGLRPLRFHVGVNDMLRAIEERLAEVKPGQPALFCTGELADSLGDAELYPVAAILAEYFGRSTNAHLELRTKSNKVQELLNVEHRGRTTVSFSISPQTHIDDYEPGTASLIERIEAGRLCQQAEYSIALKLEPLHLTAAWQHEYEEAFALIARYIDVSRLHHVSIGCLRWSKKLKEVPTFAKVYASTIQQTEWIEYRPGIFNGTVPRKERLNAYNWMRQLLRRHRFAGAVWWSLEESDLIAELESLDR